MSDSPAPAAADGSVQSHAELWALKYSVSTFYNSRPDAAGTSDLLYDAAAFETLIGADEKILSKAAAHFDEHSAETALLERLRTKYSGPQHSSTSLLDAWKAKNNTLGLLYIYGHASKKRVSFSKDDDKLSTIAFKHNYEKASETPHCLVFLNGCHTAVGDFLAATGRKGFCGFIGTETSVPYLFAHRFGCAVISLLYQGRPLVSIMNELRTCHWPLSLVYGLYAYPALRLGPGVMMPVPSPGNFSIQPVGDDYV